MEYIWRSPISREKVKELLKIVRDAFSSGNYIYSSHSGERQLQRGISDGDIRHAIANGWHEKRKDEWKSEFNAWNYAIRGTSLNDENLRIVLAVEKNETVLIVIVTVINLDSEIGA